MRLQEHAARGFEALRVDPAAFFGAEEGDYAADVVGHAHAAKRNLRGL